MNFWSYLLAGITDMLSGVLAALPLGNVNAILGTAATVLFYGVAPFLIFVGSFVNLGLLSFVVMFIITSETIRIIVATIRQVYKLIPAAG